jgi:hypothetical protein
MGPNMSLTASSATEFSGPEGINLKFENDASGAAVDVLVQIVEGDFKAIRK